MTEQVPPECTVVWDDVRAWTLSTPPPLLAHPPSHSEGAADSAREALEALSTQLHLVGEHAEPQRIGAAYMLARLGRQGVEGCLDVLGKAVGCERESVRRAATYGSAAAAGEVSMVHHC